MIAWATWMYSQLAWWHQVNHNRQSRPENIPGQFPGHNHSCCWLANSIATGFQGGLFCWVFFILRNYKGYYEVTMMHSKRLQHTASYFSSPRKVELHFLRATLDVFKEKTPTSFECSIWLLITAGRQKKENLAAVWVWVLLRPNHEKET